MVRNPIKLEEREFIVECIKLYKELPVLWNTTSKEYHNRDKKTAAYKILIAKYREMFPEATKDDVKKKLNSLRTNYRKELKKYLLSIKSEDKHVYESTLWYYKEMYFLQDLDGADSMDTNSSKSEGLCTQRKHTTMDNRKTKKAFSENIQPSSIHTNPTKKRRSRENLDEFSNWALSCTEDLKKMDPIQQIFAKNAIAAIMMEGQLGLLHRHSVTINDPAVILHRIPTDRYM